MEEKIELTTTQQFYLDCILPNTIKSIFNLSQYEGNLPDRVYYTPETLERIESDILKVIQSLYIQNCILKEMYKEELLKTLPSLDVPEGDEK